MQILAVDDEKLELNALVREIKKVFTSAYDARQRVKKNEKIIVSAETYQDQYVLNIAV